MDQNLKKEPLVSVTICSYNRADMITKAIQSAIDQSYQNIEIIVVDDASTDNTEEIVKSIHSSKPIKYFRNPVNLNIAGTRNKTVEYSSGEYIAILDSDDFWIDKNKIQEQVNFLESNKDFALVGTQAKVIDQNGNFTGEIKNHLINEDIQRNLLIRNQFIHSTVLYRKDKIIENNFFDKKNSPFEDYDLLLKIGRKNKLANLNIFTTVYREHSGGESKKLNFRKKIIFLGILIKNFPFYKNRFKSILRRLPLIS